MLSFDNSFIRELPGDPETDNHLRQVMGALWSQVMPTPVAAPKLLAYSPEMAATLGISAEQMQSSEMVNALAGNALLPGMQTYATCYGGHQFGHWAGQLGDGRAIFLGETVNAAGERWEMQLKGAGPTPYSRSADGRAVLRSSLREFLCSEAMFHLGVPTTRALSLVQTGDTVVRDMFYNGNPQAEPGAIVCRVAPSFTRFGHFQIYAARGEHALLAKLVEFTIQRDFPHIDSSGQYRVADFYEEVCERTALMIAKWMQLGFVHGVMNTDNMSILGLTIDYGPYGWVDNFDPGWTPNTTDAAGRRYCFGRQPEIAAWNLQRLGEALQGLLPEGGMQAGLDLYDQTYNMEWTRLLAGKFGIASLQPQDGELINQLFDLMTRAELDMTILFRQLALLDLQQPEVAVVQEAFYEAASLQQHGAELQQWLQRYAQRVLQDGAVDMQQRVQGMNRLNPRYVLRNYLAQQAIDLAATGDTSMISQLLEVLRQPYTDQPGREVFAARRPDWARNKAGCSMLSCSS